MNVVNYEPDTRDEIKDCGYCIIENQKVQFTVYATDVTYTVNKIEEKTSVNHVIHAL